MSVGRRTGDDGKSEMAGAFPFPEFPACFRYSLFPAFKLPAYTAKAAVKAPSEDEKKFGERSERTNAKLKNCSESEAMRAGLGARLFVGRRLIAAAPVRVIH